MADRLVITSNETGYGLPQSGIILSNETGEKGPPLLFWKRTYL